LRLGILQHSLDLAFAFQLLIDPGNTLTRAGHIPLPRSHRFLIYQNVLRNTTVKIRIAGAANRNALLILLRG
jgi:hypothetical protein